MFNERPIYFTKAADRLNALFSAFEEFEKKLTEFQIDMDSGEFEYDEAVEALNDSYLDIRRDTNKISGAFQRAEIDLLDADHCYEDEKDNE